jgi:hypothetical protein
MTGALTHSPADILRYIIIAHGWGSLPSGITNADWSVFVDNEPDRPDNCITIYNTPSKYNGRIHYGMVQELHGIQVRIRSALSNIGYTQARGIAVELDEQLYMESVTIGNRTYSVKSFNRKGDVLAFGKDSPTPTKRSIHTFNGLLVVNSCPQQ